VIQFSRVGHFVLRVADLEKSKNFYTKKFNFKVLDAEEGVVFLGLGDKLENALDLLQSKDAAASPPHREFASFKGLGFHHAGFPVNGHDELKKAYFSLKDDQVPILAAIDHGSTESVYFQDPDGNILEVYWERPDGWKKRTTGQQKDTDNALTFTR
jgi:catechol 2,3-dioxygenase